MALPRALWSPGLDKRAVSKSGLSPCRVDTPLSSVPSG